MTAATIEQARPTARLLARAIGLATIPTIAGSRRGEY